MEALYAILIVIFVPLLVFFGVVLTLITYCNPPITATGTFPEHLIHGTCTWVYDGPEPMIDLFNR